MRVIYRIVIVIAILCMFLPITNVVYAEGTMNEDYNEIYYVIYDENGQYLFERTGASVGDYYIDSDYNKYEVVKLDDVRHMGVAKHIGIVQKPNISVSDKANPIYTPMDKTICMYMTHNDESYRLSDGVDSVYGAGGIHDVAKYFANSLNGYGIKVYVDETLHIPHDTLAYSRSSSTAKSLINEYNPNAIFDIHRDGTSRSQYLSVVDGKEASKVRIVVGKANSNMEINESFAVYLMTVGNEVAPGLFKDIYYASGHYNQGLHPKAILFEMGCHMIEKELVLASCDNLAKVVNTALYNTTVDEDTGDLTINSTPTVDTPTVNDALDQRHEETQNNIDNTNTLIRLLIWGVAITAILWVVIRYVKIRK
ncbi:MAG: hypothetical protein E7361_03460 [Clostridiales bacterium]|nr:hypothetical protein [Clostridiales bacterium]